MSFTLEAVEELAYLHGEPDWLRERRREAFGVYERTGLPSKQDEEWRRTDLAGLDLEAFRPFEEADGGPPSDAISEVAGALRQRGSAAGTVELDPDLAARGVILLPLSQAAREQRGLVERHLFTGVQPGRDKFAALHAALFSGGTFLYVPDHLAVEKPFLSQFWSSGGGAAVLPHTMIVAGEGSSFSYVDEFLSPSLDRPTLTSGSAEVFAGRGSNVGYVSLQRWGSHAWQFANQRARLGQESTVRLVTVCLGGRFAKTRVEADLAGPGATAELKALFFGSGQQSFDFHTLQAHRAPSTTSDLLFKGALRDTARSLYAGLIRVEKEAQRTDAYQANRNLLLSDHAKATSIPMLEILNNDVRCTHGATVAPLDPEHLFYLESRGIPHPTAERMIVQGFFGEVLDRIPVRQARELVERELVARIG
ncbi:MAG: Fe-S cluster assembly protein SufD [Candidatus Dormibacteraceae bacterium]